VVAGRGELREDLDPDRQLGLVVVVEKAVARVRIYLDVVVDARRVEQGADVSRLLKSDPGTRESPS
jgi:hypothetical protein